MIAKVTPNTFDFDRGCKTAYDLILKLRIDEAAFILSQSKSANPSNLAILFLEDYIDILKIYISDDRALFQQLESNEKVRVSLISKAPPKSSPYIKYSLAEIHLHWALIHLKFGQYLQAFNKVKKAYNLLMLNTREFPSFVPNQKSLAIIHALLSTVPQEYKWILKTFSGLEGNMDQARFEMEQVLVYADKNDYVFKEESLLSYIILMSNFDNDLPSAINILKKSSLKHTESPLASYILAHLASKNFQNDLALKYLLERPMGSEYFPFPHLDYLTGLAKLRKLEPDAKKYFLTFLSGHTGTHFVKECYQKLAWNELIHGNLNGYNQYMSKVKSSGSSILDEDKQSQREADRKQAPNESLIRGRLLFDGGYFTAAENEIITATKNTSISKDVLLEANYRMARIKHLQKKPDEAVVLYQSILEKGKTNTAFYFACASALYLGQIMESLHRTSIAKSYYEQCLKIFPKEYSNSLHQKAKAGLNRLK